MILTLLSALLLGAIAWRAKQKQTPSPRDAQRDMTIGAAQLGSQNNPHGLNRAVYGLLLDQSIAYALLDRDGDRYVLGVAV